MGVAIVATGVLLVSTAAAAVLILAPSVGLGRHPRVSLWFGIYTAILTACMVAILFSAPLNHQVPWTWVLPTDYFLAMAHRLANGPYPFSWTPGWMYTFGQWTWLIALGGVVTVAAALSARRESSGIAGVLMAAGLLAIVAYTLGAVYASIATWGGVPL
jgi:hypothetical protein